VLAILFVTSAHADCGARVAVEAVMIVDVMAAITRRRDADDVAGSGSVCTAFAFDVEKANATVRHS